MARQNLNVGAAANDGTGDTLRQAGIKLNETFVEVYQKLGGDSDQLAINLRFDSNAVVFSGNFDTTLKASDVNNDIVVNLPDSNGTLITAEGAADLLNKTLTNATLNDVNIVGSIGDSSNNEILDFDARNNAVNYLGIRNSPTTVSPLLYSEGEDSNVSLRILPKGTGAFEYGKYALNSITHTTQDSIPTNTSLIFMDGASLDVRLGNGQVFGEFKTIVNINNASACAITADNGFTAQVLQPDQALTAVWNGTNWYVVSSTIQSAGGGEG